MKVTVVGGGNIGTLMGAEMAYKGHEVTMYTSKPEKWNDEIEVLDDTSKVLLTGKLAHVTSDLEYAVKDAAIIWVVLPAELFLDFGKKLALYIKSGQMVGVVPGSGGAEFALHDVIEKGGILFGFQRVHSIARLEEYGKSVRMLGRKSKLELGSIPAKESGRISRLVSEMFNMPCTALPNYLCVTLTPSNQILHTARLYAMFKDYQQEMVYPKNFLFYEEWTQLSSEILFDCDEELQKLCKAIPLELSDVMSLKKYYESPTTEAMTRKISGIKAFKGLVAPMIKRANGWVPDLNSRYFSTDFPYGLKVIKELAVAFDVKTPTIDTIWNWYVKFDNKRAEKAFKLTEVRKNLVEMYQ